MCNQNILHINVDNREAAQLAAKYLGYAEVTNLTLPGVMSRTNLLSAYLAGKCDKVKDSNGNTLISIGEYYQLVRDGKVEFCGKPQDDICILPEGADIYLDGRKRTEGIFLDGQFLKGYFWWIQPDGSIRGAGGRWKITL